MSHRRVLLVYPGIVSTDLDGLRLLHTFGERQMRAELITRQSLGSSLMNKKF